MKSKSTKSKAMKSKVIQMNQYRRRRGISKVPVRGSAIDMKYYTTRLVFTALGLAIVIILLANLK